MWFLLGIMITILLGVVWLSRRPDPVERDQQQVEMALWVDQVDAELQLAKQFFQDPQHLDYPRAYEILSHLAQQYELPEAYVYLAYMHQKGLGQSPNLQIAMQLLETAHQRGSDEASYYLGDIYRVQGNTVQALHWYQYAVARGSIQAQYYLAVYYFEGIDIPQDYMKAQHIWMDAAKKGHVGAQYRLGRYLWNGEGFAQNHVLAKQYLYQAANQQHPEAIALLQQIDHGLRREQPHTEYDFQYLKQQAFSGHGTAQYEYCFAVLKGLFDPQQQASVVALLVDQAEKNTPYALNLLGTAYAQGLGVELDLRHAFQYWTRAAHLNHSVALCHLAHSQAVGVLMPANSAAAFELYQQAYQKDPSALTIFLLAECYLVGCGITENWEKAIDLITVAAKQKFQLDVCHEADALYALALFYADPLNEFGCDEQAQKYVLWAAEDGSLDAIKAVAFGYLDGQMGFEKNAVQARHYFSLAVVLNDMDAHCQLGCLYLEGQGGSLDFDQAFAHFSIASHAGDRLAMTYLAQCYEQGWGVVEDMPQALALYIQASELGEREAYYHLGRLYAQGHGVVRQIDQALVYLIQAENLGHQKAKRLYDSLQQEYLH